jgi:putative sterol carrier protein
MDDDYSIENITARLARAAAQTEPTGKTIKFDLGGDRPIIYDGAQTPAVVSNEDREVHATVRMSLQTFADLAEGRAHPATAMMTGKVKISGDMSAAMGLQRVLDHARASS